MKTEKVAVTTNNKTNGGSNMKGFFGGMKKKLVPALCGMGMMMSQMTTTCFAAGTGTSAVTQPLENLKTLVIAVIGAVGVIILAKNVTDLYSVFPVPVNPSSVRWKWEAYSYPGMMRLSSLTR